MIRSVAPGASGTPQGRLRRDRRSQLGWGFWGSWRPWSWRLSLNEMAWSGHFFLGILRDLLFHRSSGRHRNATGGILDTALRGGLQRLG